MGAQGPLGLVLLPHGALRDSALSVGGIPAAAARAAAFTGPAVVLKIVPEGEDAGPTTLKGRSMPGRE